MVANLFHWGVILVEMFCVEGLEFQRSYFRLLTVRLPVKTAESTPGSQAHVCPYCGIVLRAEIQLQRHLRFNCKLVPRHNVYQCNRCPYRSTYKANIERHVKNLHGTDTDDFKCQLCSFKSKYSYCVRRHMKTFHMQ
ncbi:hypothetical protein QAD02_022616 [Eretmocerus hayati]|uniref:Uncharacterized protein n=1 Tax=Eretmocerus hayati TaxID=131215 RepID=A0ACC2PTU2_9HYME|nr:hypothetical protein QAD02_022616 [Eretmocerus hayati]